MADAEETNGFENLVFIPETKYFEEAKVCLNYHLKKILFQIN